MKQFLKIFKFELKNYFVNKVFVGVTLFLAVVIAVVMFFPRISDMFDSGEDIPVHDDLPIMIVSGKDITNRELVEGAFKEAFVDYDIRILDLTVDEITQKITDGEAECAFYLNSLTSYKYYVNNLSMYDMNASVANEVLKSIYQMNTMMQSGLTLEQVQNVMNVPVESETVTIGKDQIQNFFYTYIMIFALYMVILLYGQMVATNVATEKSSRAMELLITSAKPVSMMFGKVIASCLAGFIQLVAVFGTAFVCFNLNREYWDEGGVMSSVFNMPLELLVYMLVFFVLGFLMYAFLFGAVGSTASKLEDINTSVMPITLLFVAGFMVVMLSMAEGSVDNTLMLICSYIPFTSPMAMFTRIAMSTVELYEILISIAVLIVSVIGVGVISAKIYRIGVMMYGTPPKIGAIIKALRKS